MAWRIHDQVVRVMIDNRTRGSVTGSVWLAGREQPLQLDLKGNAGPDMAGCLLMVENPVTVPDPLEGLAAEQRGVCGDMTASRKVKIPTVPLMEWLESHRGEPFPFVWGNGIYLEWYSERNGRVVIEMSGCNATLSEPEWRLTPAQEAVQQRESAEASATFMCQLAVAVRDSNRGGSNPALAETDDADRLKAAEAEQRARIEALKQRVREVTGEQNLFSGESEDATLDEVEGFWKRVLECEEASLIRVRDLLRRDGVKPPPPARLSDNALSKQLATLIQGLAHRRIYLQFTDHLSDRQLYTLLINHVLEDQVEVTSPDSGWNSHVDMSVLGLAENDDGSETYLKYYADESAREQWASDFPDDPLPPHEDPPYDRDRALPKPE